MGYVNVSIPNYTSIHSILIPPLNVSISSHTFTRYGISWTLKCAISIPHINKGKKKVEWDTWMYQFHTTHLQILHLIAPLNVSISSHRFTTHNISRNHRMCHFTFTHRQVQEEGYDTWICQSHTTHCTKFQDTNPIFPTTALVFCLSLYIKIKITNECTIYLYP